MNTQCHHCWHHSGRVLLQEPPVHVYVCCYCGDNTQVLREAVKSHPGHGPFAPGVPGYLGRAGVAKDYTEQPDAG